MPESIGDAGGSQDFFSFKSTRGRFPHSREYIEKNFTRVPEGVRRKMTYSNVVSLYQMDLG